MALTVMRPRELLASLRCCVIHANTLFMPSLIPLCVAYTDWKNSPVRLVRAEFLIGLWQSGQHLPPRQDAPEHAFYDGPPDRARLVAVC